MKNILLVLFLFLGCATPNSDDIPKPFNIVINGPLNDGSAILNSFNELGVKCRVYTGDYKYDFISDDKIDKIVTDFADWISDRGITYKQEEFDCEDYCREAITFIQRNRNTKYAVAVGEIWYKTRPSAKSYHAILCFVQRDGRDYSLTFYDPSADSLISLTREQFLSSELIKF